MKLTNSRIIGICLIVSASVVASSSSYADSETVQACVKKSNGDARIISGKMKCAKTERLVTWTSTNDSLVGPVGATGLTGAAGPKGERGLTGPVGLTGAAGLNGVDGINGRNGVDGTNGLDGAVGATGAQGLTGATGATGPSGISKALVASGNQVSINQGTEGVVLSATIPAGKYAMSLSATLSYSNSSGPMSGMANLGCFITSSTNYVDAATTATSNFWPELNNSSPNRLSFESMPASGDELMKRSFAAYSILELNSSTQVKWICRHYSSVADDSNEQVIIRYPRIILTAVDQLVTLN